MAVLAVEHVEEHGQRGFPQLRLAHQRHLKERPHHGRNKVDLVIADGVPHRQDLEAHPDAHVAVVAQHVLALILRALLQLKTRLRQEGHRQVEVATP